MGRDILHFSDLPRRECPQPSGRAVAGFFGETRRTVVAAPILQKWTCRSCGRTKETELRPEQGRCDECAQGVPSRPGDAAWEQERRTVLVRLRERYNEVRQMVSLEEPHSNLDWLIGSSGRPEFEPADIDADMAQVAVLWLQDVARELDGEALPTVGPVAGGQDRPEAARGLRTATADFAEAFLTTVPDSAVSS
jgi:hypothetical protein